ncbi:MAG TPA: cupin domain-containing protein [Solirubrobacteraceae bacterium]|nr:cupin domain-containing protein [Solirubrobacteraceae bacterium]
MSTLAGLEWERFNERIERKVVDGERMTCTRYRFAPGGCFPLHSHDQEQLAYLIDGQVTFTLPDGDRVLAPGDVLIIAPAVPHSALAGEGGAEVLSVVTPARTGGRGIDMLDDDQEG